MVVAGMPLVGTDSLHVPIDTTPTYLRLSLSQHPNSTTPQLGLTTTRAMSAMMSLQRCQSVLSVRSSHVRATAPRTAAAVHVQRRQQHVCRADAGDTPPATTTTTEQQQQPEQPVQQEQTKASPSAPLLAPGQGTAIVTGAISIIFGIAYLVLVSLLDMRGGELLPPPPEAFLQ
jgi:hypothetical protein